MPNSKEAASNEMLWERVLCLLVVGASIWAEAPFFWFRRYHQYSMGSRAERV
jgi:hypothetical protein